MFVVFFQGDRKLTATHLAAQYGHLHFLQYLKKFDISLENTDSAGRHPIYYAIIHKHHDVFDFLLRNSKQGRSVVSWCLLRLVNPLSDEFVWNHISIDHVSRQVVAVLDYGRQKPVYMIISVP